MQEKIEEFKILTLKEQKELIIIVLSKSIENSKWLKRLYDVVNSVDISIRSDFLKQEFLKIYIFLMEAVDYIKSKKLNESLKNLNKFNEILKKIREDEKKDLDILELEKELEKELFNL